MNGRLTDWPDMICSPPDGRIAVLDHDLMLVPCRVRVCDACTPYTCFVRLWRGWFVWSCIGLDPVTGRLWRGSRVELECCDELELTTLSAEVRGYSADKRGS